MGLIESFCAVVNTSVRKVFRVGSVHVHVHANTAVDVITLCFLRAPASEDGRGCTKWKHCRTSGWHRGHQTVDIVHPFSPQFVNGVHCFCYFFGVCAASHLFMVTWVRTIDILCHLCISVECSPQYSYFLFHFGQLSDLPRSFTIFRIVLGGISWYLDECSWSIRKERFW